MQTSQASHKQARHAHTANESQGKAKQSQSKAMTACAINPRKHLPESVQSRGKNR